MLWLVLFVVTATSAELRNNGNNPKNGSAGWMEQLKLQLMRNNYDYEPSSKESELTHDGLDRVLDTQDSMLNAQDNTLVVQRDHALDGPQQPQDNKREYIYVDETTDALFVPRQHSTLTTTDNPSRRDNGISRNDLLYYVDDARLAQGQLGQQPNPPDNRLESLDNQMKSLHNRLRLPDNGLASLNNRHRLSDKRLDSQDNLLRSKDNPPDSLDNRLNSLDKQLRLPDNDLASLNNRHRLPDKRLDSQDNLLRSKDNPPDSLDNRLNSLDKRLRLLDHQDDSLDNRLKSLDKRLHSADNIPNPLDNQLRPPASRLDWLDNHLNSLKNLVHSPVNHLSSLDKRLTSLKNELRSPGVRLGSPDNRVDASSRDNRRDEDSRLDDGSAEVTKDPQKKVSYKLLKLANKSRRAGEGPRFVEERGAGGVALLSLDGAPFPQFRLPAPRRQYRAAPLSETDPD